MSLIIKKNTTFKIPRTASGAPSGIPISTGTIIVLTVAATSAAIVGSYNKQSDTEWWWGSDYYLRYDGTWYFQNEDTGSTSYHPTGTNPNFIPNTGWNDGITITAA
jgi:hypothetical protein